MLRVIYNAVVLVRLISYDRLILMTVYY